MKLVLSERREIAESTLAVWFEPEKSVRFTAGQFGDFTLMDPPCADGKGSTRTFSFANAPEEDRILIATRVRESAFKRSLATIPLGAPVQLTGPMGSFTLHKDSGRPAVCLTGGIGITPVRSIVAHATLQRMPHRIFVFYSNRTAGRLAFLNDFQTWAQTNGNLKFIPTLTQETPKNWDHERGPISGRMLSKYLPDLQSPVYYVVGPPAMVAAMMRVLEEIGIDDMQIRSEDFAGYE